MRTLVELYEHADFQGEILSRIEVVDGDTGFVAVDFAEVGIRNDSVSSLRVPSPCRVILFEHGQWQGQRKEFTEDTNYVGDDFNDTASSMQIIILPQSTS